MKVYQVKVNFWYREEFSVSPGVCYNEIPLYSCTDYCRAAAVQIKSHKQTCVHIHIVKSNCNAIYVYINNTYVHVNNIRTV